MKKFIFSMITSVACVTAIAIEPSVDAGGSNASGAESVCLINYESTLVFNESFKKCKKGDIVNLSGMANLGIMQYCDFNKTIIYAQGIAIACVFTGSRRSEIKNK